MFQLIVEAGAEQKILPFETWRTEALAYAAAHPNSPLGRIALLLDGCTKETAAKMFKPSAVGGQVFGGDQYPTPMVNAESTKAHPFAYAFNAVKRA